MPRRIESPSSLLTYKQCPRKYYYQYIEKQPTTQNIHTVRGNIVHEVLNSFFSSLPPLNEETYLEQCVLHLRSLFDKEWEKKKQAFLSLGVAPVPLRTFYIETLAMLSLWLEKFLIRLAALQLPIQESFRLLTPLREQKFVSSHHSLQGYIDAIETTNGYVRVMDYKTSNKAEISGEYKLQLGLYALLYKETHGHAPQEVGIYFLKHANQFEQTIPVTDELVKDAQFAVETHHLSTISGKMQDYPQKIGPLCKWSTGQCDFYGLCFPKQRRLDGW